MNRYPTYILVLLTILAPSIATAQTLCTINYIIIQETLYSKKVIIEENKYLEASKQSNTKTYYKEIIKNSKYNFNANIAQLFNNSYDLKISKNSINVENLAFIFTSTDKYTSNKNYSITRNGNTIRLIYNKIGNTSKLTLINKEKYSNASLERTIKMDCQNYDKSKKAFNSYINNYPDFFNILIWDTPATTEFQKAKDKVKKNNEQKYKEYIEERKKKQKDLSIKRKRNFIEKEQNKIDIEIEEKEKKPQANTEDTTKLPSIDQIS